MKGTSNILWKRVFVFLTFYLFTFLPLFAQSWPDVKNEARAGSRWWWLGSAVDKDNLQWNLKQYADHGIGSLEITPIYGVQGNQQNDIPYLSDKWMSMFREAQVYGKALGIEIDMSTGCRRSWFMVGLMAIVQLLTSQRMSLTENSRGHPSPC